MSEELEIVGQELDCTTGEVKPIFRDEKYDEMMRKAAEATAEYEAILATRAVQRAALLERLGITEEEAQLLLGGN